MTETVAITYWTLGEECKAEDGTRNCVFLSAARGREVLLLDVLQTPAFLRLLGGSSRGTHFAFFAVVGGAYQPLASAACALPVSDGISELVLVPSSAPSVIVPLDQAPEWFLLSTAPEQTLLPLDEPLRPVPVLPVEIPAAGSSSGRSGASSNRGSVASAAEEGVSLRPPKRQQQLQQQQHAAAAAAELNRAAHSGDARGRGSRTGSAPRPTESAYAAPLVDETVAVLAGAASVATEATGQAARSLFNFAAKSLQTVVHGVSSVTGHQQVGHHRVAIVKELAQGGFGIVFLVRDTQHPDRLYAMKQMFCQSREQMEEAHHELRILQQFSGKPNLIRLLDHGSVSASKGQHRQVLLLFPFFGGGSAWDRVETALRDGASTLQDSSGPPPAFPAPPNWPFPEREALQTIRGVARALRTLHSAGYVHRDVKPHNVLLSESMEAVLMDLGSVGPARVQVRGRSQAMRVEDEASCKCSAPYRAPELTQVANECDLDEKVDTWSLGCTAFCLAFGSSPFESPREGVLKLAILNAKFSFPQGHTNALGVTYSREFVALVASMLQLNPRDRPDMQTVMDTCKRLLAATSPAGLA